VFDLDQSGYLSGVFPDGTERKEDAPMSDLVVIAFPTEGGKSCWLCRKNI
jgi:hypothetical protein